MPVWKARDPGGTWRRWSNTYSMVYYDSGAKKWAALDPNGNRAYVGDSQESAERAFEIFAGPAHDSGLTNSERDFFAGVTSGLHPLGFLYTPFLEANGVDTTSREFAWGAGFAALGSFTSSVTATGGGTIRVGRWMSQAEYKAMSNSGVVQESLLNGVTSVSIPADINAFRNPAARSVFVEFDVPRSAIRTQTQGWGKIYGPNSIFGKRLGITEMPPATNIEPKVSNLKQGW
jgi:hypothetical protein